VGDIFQISLVILCFYCIVDQPDVDDGQAPVIGGCSKELEGLVDMCLHDYPDERPRAADLLDLVSRTYEIIVAKGDMELRSSPYATQFAKDSSENRLLLRTCVQAGRRLLCLLATLLHFTSGTSIDRVRIQ
jgi:hypothetical protein